MFNNDKCSERGKDGKGKKLSAKSKAGMRPLGPSFLPGPTDVICARGGAAYNHPGNCRFRVLIEQNANHYAEATNKTEKSSVVSFIIASIREATPQGHFIKEESGEWHDVGEAVAREKVGQNFRDFLHTMYRSSSKAKQHRSKVRGALSESAVKNISNHASLPVASHEADHQRSLSSMEGNSAQSIHSKIASSSVAKNQASDTLPANTLVPSSNDNCDYIDPFPAYTGDNTTKEFRMLHDDAETSMQSEIKERASFYNQQEMGQLTPSSIFRRPLALPPGQLVDNASGAVSIPAMDPEAGMTVNSSAGSPLVGPLSIGVDSFDELFVDDGIINEDEKRK